MLFNPSTLILYGVRNFEVNEILLGFEGAFRDATRFAVVGPFGMAIEYDGVDVNNGVYGKCSYDFVSSLTFEAFSISLAYACSSLQALHIYAVTRLLILDFLNGVIGRHKS